MKNEIWKHSIRHLLMVCLLLVGSFWLVSCEDDYIYDDQEPEWLGESIYDYLVEQQRFTNFVRLIDDIGYGEVLARTGSKTLFVADDAAFERFFTDNPWGVGSYQELSLAQKKLIMNFGMIDNAYLLGTLANYNSGGLVEGAAIRRTSALSPFDSIVYESGNILPSSPYWEPYRTSGLYMLTDQTSKPIMYFLQRPLENAAISDADFKLITGVERQNGDAHLFDIKVVEADVTCKNGYVHILEEVMLPPLNMAEHIRSNERTQIFSELLERFSAPYYFSQWDQDYKLVNPDFTDTLFVKGYFSRNAANGPTTYPDGTTVPVDLRLIFNPGNNNYSNGPLQADMATLLAPSDAAMQEYLATGSGAILSERFGSWEGIPDNIVIKFLDRHMRTSFLESVPARFDKMSDGSNNRINITSGDIQNTYLASNGLVYETNAVYPPNDYVSVYAPVLFGANTKIFNWIINRLDYTFYLNSLVSRYSFFVPTDEFFENYIDPFTIGKNVPGALKFKYNESTSNVNAIIHAYDPETNTVGDSIGVVNYGNPNQPNEYNDFILNRLWDILDNHVVVGDVESGSAYSLTKGGTLVKTEGSGMGLKVMGGGDLERDVTVNVTDVYEQENGRTYFIDKPIQPPLRSVYSVLSQNEAFNSFFELLTGFPVNHASEIFVRKTNYYGVDFNVKFFNTYNYTVYVPTNDAVNAAIEAGLIHPWNSSPERPGIIGINEMESQEEQQAAIKELERFLRYHFQDNAVLISGEPVDQLYQTATIKLDDAPSKFGTYKNKYYKVEVSGDGSDLSVEMEGNGVAQVLTENNLFNIITREHVFNANLVVTGKWTDQALAPYITSHELQLLRQW
ncbi:fasciclin domain-containing protein [Geofilum rubicundum]|uniref:FAS1 domain-containing protein n=1 Tax=Geofilum rubicundum JCM 15548 TaxID=1236989 RepID=A0A0E9M111_9BACT|nr:fasciclin domain-containing protein [Geofilum rubicundum]GAO30830.1 hypothetical protein JCM15548_13144 [Geofilum rubicundum JCM 15548]